MSDKEHLLVRSAQDSIPNGTRKRKTKRSGFLAHHDLVLAHSVSSEADGSVNKARLNFLKLMRKNRLRISRSYLSQVDTLEVSVC